MAKVSSGLSLSKNYFLRDFYKNNRDLIKKSKRNDYSKKELSYGDSQALSRAAKRMLKTEFDADSQDEGDIDDTLLASIQAFTETYNNAIESSDKNDPEAKHYMKQLKSLTKKYASELADIGLTVESSGKITIKEDLLKIADSSKVHKLFGSDKEFSTKSLSISKKLNSYARNSLISEITGNGLRINISL